MSLPLPVEPGPSTEWSIGMLRDLFPEGVCVVATNGADDPPPLMPDEVDAIRRAVPSRQREFALGRWCARLALEELEIAPVSIPTGEDRSPTWPHGVVGSITHCRDFVAAAAARVERLASLGFDAERAEELRSDVHRLVCTPAEVEWARAHARSSLDWPKVMFSAKESIHKCIWPLCGQTLDFRDVIVSIDPDAMTFTARETQTPALTTVDFTRIRGRIAVTDGFVFTSAIIEQDAAGRVA